MKGAEKDEEVVLKSELEELVCRAGINWQDYTNCNQDLATTIGPILLRITGKRGFCQEQKQGTVMIESDEEEDDEITIDTAPVLSWFRFCKGDSTR